LTSGAVTEHSSFLFNHEKKVENRKFAAASFYLLTTAPSLEKCARLKHAII
jgi:hypothetical protein